MAQADGLHSVADCFERFNAEGYRQRVAYPPADRFWPLQFAETAFYLVLSAGLGWFCFWWVRRIT